MKTTSKTAVGGKTVAAPETPKARQSFVISHPEMGVFLGLSMGFAFWSKLDPVGQDHAPAFDNEAQAEEFMAKWDNGRPQGVSLVPVLPDLDGYVSVATCVAAGLPGWIDEQMPVANQMPI
ncbi:hypothetical protein [Variovorax gossypii]|jgi:hypothetical protein|uniref:hypothetical protein n=1 Tax=uncultured Variovorax sp. TaxID=114708 RepID=UPI0026396829|nr:hypothetical protein [uncultured Variovorax sp.]